MRRRFPLPKKVTPSLAGALAVLCARAASAHFSLQAPASWANQDSVGSPQKSAPCGQADPGLAAVATGKVTAFAPGETITITINETIFHPGHYRVVLAVNDRSELPADPVVTPGTSDCGSAVIQSPAVFPVLADGALLHNSAFSGPQSFQVKLPSDVTCSKCTLQVAEFMSQHGLNDPGGCFYHHCADISILPQAGASGSGGAPAAGGATTAGGVASGGRASGGSTSGGSANGGSPSGGAAVTTGGVLGASGSASAGTPSDVGCGCRSVGRAGTSSHWLGLAVACAAWLGRRRQTK
ncbi:MAG: hypothetical protein QM756_39430 [Polyangiaceae bacterium]